MDAESVLKLKGQGDAGRSGGPPGDLYVTFVVKASAGMRRRGLDLYSEVRMLGDLKQLSMHDGFHALSQLPPCALACPP